MNMMNEFGLSDVEEESVYQHVINVIEQSGYDFDVENAAFIAYKPHIDSFNFLNDPWNKYLLQLKKEMPYKTYMTIALGEDLKAIFEKSKYYPSLYLIFAKEENVDEIKKIYFNSINNNNVILIYDIENDSIELLEKSKKYFKVEDIWERL